MDEAASVGIERDSRPLLVAADWQSRALLLVELEERGVEIRAEAGIEWALHAIIRGRIAPPLVLVDTTDDADATPHRVQQLMRILQEDGIAPTLMLLTSAYQRREWQEVLGNVAQIVTRPKTVNEIATLVEAHLKGTR